MGGATRPWRPPVLPRLPKLFQTTSLSQWRRRKLKTRKKRKNKERNKEDGNHCELTPKTSARISIEEELKIGRDDDWCTMVHGAWCTMVHHGAWCMVHHGAWCMVHHGAWCMVHGAPWCMVHGAWCTMVPDHSQTFFRTSACSRTKTHYNVFH